MSNEMKLIACIAAAPFTGAWIEIAKSSPRLQDRRSRPLHGGVD